MTSGLQTKRRYFAYRSFWPELEAMKRFYDSGIRSFCFYSANTANLLGEPYTKYPPVWVWDQTYAFENLDRQIDDILSVAPEADLICMIDLNTPFWYVRYHGNNGEIYDTFDQLGRVESCPRWRQDTLAYLQAFLEHTESKYADHISSYILACGSTCEWLDRSAGDASISRTQAYQRYCQKQGLPVPADIPPYSVRFRNVPEFIRSPETDREALTYWKFTQEEMVDTVTLFLKAARQAIKRPEVELGTFFGYILQLGLNELTTCGHLAYERLFQLPELDFVVSPGIYYDRAIGGGGGAMMPLETLYGNGKRYLHECDQRTHTFNPNLSKYAKLPFLHFKDETETMAGMKREFSFSLLHRCSMWWFDMWGGYYQGENIFRLLRHMHDLWDRYDDDLLQNHPAEVLLVVDPESALYMDEKQDRIWEFVTALVRKLNHIGTPYRVASFNDLKTLPNLTQYKLVIMAMPFVLDQAKRQLLEDRLETDGRTILWQYAPGIVSEDGYCEDNVRKTCGTPFRTEGCPVVQMAGWRSAYAYAPEAMTPALLRQLGQQAGVHLYCPEGIPVYAAGNLLALHVGSSMSFHLSLPRTCSTVKELFTGQTWHHVQDINLDITKPDTLLLELSAD